MARITVEDCEKVVGNRFELVILAVQRARQMLEGDTPTIDDSDDEKKSVVALREIAARTVSVEDLREKAINGFRSFMPAEDEEEDPEDLTEEDTYNPYEGISKQALEKETARFTHETEESAKDSNLR